jgi:hypothetical protein
MVDVVELDAATGAVTERDFTVDELAQRALDLEESLAAQAATDEAAAVKAVAREALLARLGITADEAQLLLGN